MMKRVRLVGSTLALAAAVVTIVQGYAYGGHKWAVRQIPYYINPANQDMSASAAIAAIQAAATTWSTQPNSDVTFYYMGQTSGNTLQNNGKNEVFFRSDTGPLGETYRWWDGSGHLVDADTVFHDASNFYVGGSTGCTTGYYLQNVATHELGHALGFDHSSVTTATMYPGEPQCDTSKEVLDPDDLAGVEAVYPASSGSASNTAPSLTLSSPATGSTFSNATTISFSASASDSQDGVLTSRIIWTSSLLGQFGVGGTVGAALPIGTNVVTASVTDSGGLTTTTQITVYVTSTSGGSTTTSSSLSLSALAYTVKQGPRVNLSWSGSSAASIDIYRNGKLVATTPNDGSQTDNPGRKATGTITYKVCNAGTQTCSGTASVVF